MPSVKNPNATAAEAARCQWQDIDPAAPYYRPRVSIETRAALAYFRKYDQPQQEKKESA